MEAEVLEAGFALAHYTGTGRDGPADVLDVVCSAEALRRLTDVVTHVDPKASLYTQELAGLRGGSIYGLKSKI